MLIPCSSKEHIFDPLGMSTASFYLTPNLRKDLVDLTFQADDGTLHPWADQMEIIERDPQKRTSALYKSCATFYPCH